MTPGMRWCMAVLCYLWMGAWTVIFCGMAAGTMRELGGWSLVQKANNTFGQLLAAMAAIAALSLAYREYRLRTAPVFYCKVVPKDFDPKEAIRHFYVVNTQASAILLKTEVVGRVPSWVKLRAEYPEILLEPMEKTSPINISFDPEEAKRHPEDEIAIRFFGQSLANLSSRVTVVSRYLPSRSLSSFPDRAHRQKVRLGSPLS